METVFLYAGQGSQRPGMGRDFYEEYPAYRAFADSLDPGFDHIRLMHEGPAELLSRTEYTQVCMGVFAAGVTKLLLEQGVMPAAACGLSLGEYGALLAAGVFSAEEYIDLLKFRGQAMADAARGLDCAMSAVLGPDLGEIREVCEQCGDVTPANCNCPGQIVICGGTAAVAAAEELLRARGVRRCVRLAVSGPFHTKYMAPAGEALKKKFSGMTFRAPEIPVAMNVTGRLLDPSEDVKELLVRQVQQTVLLEQDLRALLDAGYTDFTEIGPGSTMAGFLKKTARAAGKQITVRSIDTAEDLRKAVQV